MEEGLDPERDGRRSACGDDDRAWDPHQSDRVESSGKPGPSLEVVLPTSIGAGLDCSHAFAFLAEG